MLEQSRRESMFNVPAVVLILAVVLGGVHAYFLLALTAEQKIEFLLLFAFIPARYDATVTPDIVWPGGWAADVWTFVTYALIHGNLTHLIFNVMWIIAFGSPVARRFGPFRFLVFMAFTAAAGAAAHLITRFGDLLPMIGASAAISGAMAAATRFALQPGGPLTQWRSEEAYQVPAAPLTSCLQDARVLAFLLVWFGVNLLFGLGSIGMFGVDESIAWQAHIGGFLAGLLAFAAFDPVPRSSAADKGDESPPPTV
jgi:membrane associated rhomboid family serine protease